MARDFWMTLRNALNIKRIKKNFVIPAATYNCGEIHSCLLFGSATVSGLNLALMYNFHDAFTIEAWIKIPGNTTVRNVFNYSDFIGNNILSGLQLNSRKVRVKVRKGAVDFTVDSALEVPLGEWTHIAATYDGITVRIYIDGVLDANTLAIAAPLDFSGIQDGVFIGSEGGGTPRMFLGYLDELRLWDIALTSDQVLYQKDSPRNTTALDTVDDNLKVYFKCNSGTPLVESIAGGTIIFVSSATGLQRVTDEHAPLKYGASFIVAQTDITLGKKVSLRFPKVPPDGLTGQFAVMWVDDNDVVQRRKLWSTDGVDIAPILAAYNGEPLPSPFRIEFWNIDGETTAIIPSNVELRISDTTMPTTSYDSTSIVAATPTIDTTLAQPFPLTPFPLTFDVQQTY